MSFGCDVSHLSVTVVRVVSVLAMSVQITSGTISRKGTFPSGWSVLFLTF